MRTCCAQTHADIEDCLGANVTARLLHSTAPYQTDAALWAGVKGHGEIDADSYQDEESYIKQREQKVGDIIWDVLPNVGHVAHTGTAERKRG